MEREEIIKRIENILPKIKKFMSSYSDVAEKLEDEINEKDYEVLKELSNEYEKLYSESSVLVIDYLRKFDIIQTNEKRKKIAPLVPLEEIPGGKTEEELMELKSVYDEMKSLLFESKEFRSFYYDVGKGIENLISKYEEREKQREEERKTKIETERIVEEVKKLILSPEKPKLVLATVHDPSWNGDSVDWTKSLERGTSEKILILFEKYGIKPEFFDQKFSYDENESLCGNRYPSTAFSHLSFTPYEECDLPKKQKCREYEEMIKDLQSRENGENDRPGIILLKINCMTEVGRVIENLRLECSYKEIIDAGMLPEDLGWTDRTQISEIDMSRLDKGSKIRRRELAPIKKVGFKEWFEGLFKGRSGR